MKVRVQLDNDHLERLTRTNAISAVAELIWNSLDADARQVDVVGERNGLMGLELLRVTDNGHGISHSEATSEFGFLGGSWKKTAHKSRGDKRILHGKDGEGRYKAFSLGNHVKWTSSYKENDRVKQFTISGRRPGLTDFEVTDPESSDVVPGTVVEVSDLSSSKISIFDDTEKVVRELAQRFALYLRQYPDVSVVFDGKHVDQTRYEADYAEYDLDPITLPDGTIHDAKLIVIEWNIPFNRAIYFCNADGFTLDKRPPGIQEPGFDFTAYVKSDLIPELEGTGAFALEEMHPEFKALIDSVKTTLKTHFRQRRAVLAKTLVDEWKEKKSIRMKESLRP